MLHGSVVGHARAVARRPRSLMDDDLLGPVLSMFSGPRCHCCKQLSLCDMATILLEAVEANKAQDVETLRRLEHDHSPRRYQVDSSHHGLVSIVSRDLSRVNTMPSTSTSP